MVRLSSKIIFCSATSSRDITFTNINEVKIVTSVENLTDTFSIKIPRKIEYQGHAIAEFIRHGDSVAVHLGYDDNLIMVIKGYVKRVTTGTPLIIECENEAWKLKNVYVEPKQYDLFNIQDFAKEVLPQYEQKVTNIPLGLINIKERITVLQCLDILKKDYNFNFCFRENDNGETKFYGGLIYTEIFSDKIKTLKFKVGKNIVSTALKFTLKEDIKVQIVSKNIILDNGKNKKIEAKYPDTVGSGYNIQTYYVNSAQDEKTLREDAKRRHDQANIDTMDGNFIAFGHPFVRKGDIIHLLDDINAEQNNKYFFVKAVTYLFGTTGYRQTIELGGVA